MDWIPFPEIHTFWILLIFAGALGILIVGGDGLLRGSSALASHWGLSPLIIGLTVVSLSTSTPELVVSIVSVLSERPDLGIGNLIGSNIANLGAILAFAALWRAIPTHRRLVRFDLPFMIAATLLFWVLAAGGAILSRWDGALLLLLFLCYILSILLTHRETAVTREMIHEIHPPLRSVLSSILWIAGGTAGLFLGAELMVGSASEMARRIGVREAWIGLTLVAVGTSLPEWATTVLGIWRRQTDLVIGNLIGSNFFNLALIGGLTGLLVRFPVSADFLTSELPLMVIITLLASWFLISDRILSRKEGLGLLLLYLFFLGLASVNYWN